MRRSIRWGVMVAAISPLLVNAAVLGGPAGAAGTAIATSCSGAVAVVAAPGAVGTKHGILRPEVPSANATCALSPMAAESANGSIAMSKRYQGGSPPLTIGSGDTMGAPGAPGAITLTPIFWAPPTTSFPSGYVEGIEALDTNLAAQSGTPGTALSELTQYTTASGAHLQNTITAGTPIFDTTTTPESLGVTTCSPDTGPIYNDNARYSLCITDFEVAAEVAAQVTSGHLPSDRAHLYAVFTPKGAEVCFGATNGTLGGTCTPNSQNSSSGFCAYHSGSSQNPSATLYAAMPYSVWDSPTRLGCNGSDQFPQRNAPVDVIASSYVHEIAEAITDPVGTSWLDSQGNEIGDLCAYSYGPTSGSPGALVSQVFGGAGYYIQQLFSNASFAKNRANGCQSRWTKPTVSVTASGVLQVKKAVSFSAKVSAPSGAIAARRWTSNGVVLGTSATLSQTFLQPGAHTVSLTVTDSGGYSTTASTMVTIAAAAKVK